MFSHVPLQLPVTIIWHPSQMQRQERSNRPLTIPIRVMYVSMDVCHIGSNSSSICNNAWACNEPDDCTNSSRSVRVLCWECRDVFMLPPAKDNIIWTHTIAINSIIYAIYGQNREGLQILPLPEFGKCSGWPYKMDIQLICAVALMFNTLNMNLEGLLHDIPNVHASHESENQDLAPFPSTNRDGGLFLRSRYLQ